MTGAVAAATSRVKVGTWVLSALHRNPGITAKAVETLDEISGGRFVFGLGSGHAGRQAHAFGLPEDHVYGRFEEAIEIIVPLLRQGRADFEGTFHAARDLEQRPRRPAAGPDPDHDRRQGPEDAPSGRAPMPTSGAGTSRSGATSTSSGRGSRRSRRPASRSDAIRRRSASRPGIVVEPTVVTGVGGSPRPSRSAARPRRSPTRSARSGPAASRRSSSSLWPPTLAALDAMAPVLELLDAG